MIKDDFNFGLLLGFVERLASYYETYEGVSITEYDKGSHFTRMEIADDAIRLLDMLKE